MVKFVNYAGYGKCVELNNGKSVMRITCDVGPRVIYLANDGGKNLFYEDREDLINKSGTYFDENYSKGEAWHIYGGHRLWKSPEDLASYYPDNKPVDVQLLDNGAVFTGEYERTTGIRKIVKVTMDGEKIVLDHTFVNESNAHVEYSLWCLSVMDKGGVCYIPFSKEDTGLLANRNLVIWPYTDIQDERIAIRNDALLLKQNPAATTAIKLGLLNTLGEQYYLRGNDLLEIKTAPAPRDGNYPDYCSSTETYTNGIMLEVETLSELKTIAPGASATHTEVWTLYNEKDAKYAEVKKIVEG